MYGADTIKNLKKDLNGVPVVVAYHDLKGTPSSEEIANILKKEIDAGGDVAKIVVKPNSQADVLRFLNGTLEFRTKNPAYPVIASASGQEGRITRLAGGLFGIDLTFASGVKGSNPGRCRFRQYKRLTRSSIRLLRSNVFSAEKSSIWLD